MHACIALIKKLLVKSCYIWRGISLLLEVVPKCLMVLHRVEKKQLWIKQSCALALFYDFHFDSYQADTSLRSWPFDFWGGEGGMGDFRKKYPSDWLSGKTNSCKEIPEEKNSYTDKISFKACKAGIKCYTSGFQEKNSITRGQIICTPLKSQMVGP